MKIYFAGSIRGGRDDQELYFGMIAELQKYATVLTEHIGNKDLGSFGEVQRTDTEIFVRDMDWVKEADLIVAEVTTPSLGVGYELGQSEALGKPVLCLYRETEGKRLSAMVSGNSYFKIETYQTLDDISRILATYFEQK
ncbi:MAG: nucleoside 2-deoxyribosyltransferase [Patescibacteria group bacterium]